MRYRDKIFAQYNYRKVGEYCVTYPDNEDFAPHGSYLISLQQASRQVN